MSSLIRLKTDKGVLIADLDMWKAEREYMKQKEKEYWNYCLSGQRTLDLFGEEGSKRVLEEQRKRDEKGL